MSLTMYDDITLSLIPADAEAVAGYVNGRWPTYTEVVNRWPKARHLSIAVNQHADAECLDVEPGDAINSQAAAWVKRQIARGVHKPVVYTSVSNVDALLKALASGGVKREQIRLWSAHYTGSEHLCGPTTCRQSRATADATQWTDKALGRSLDRSICSPAFFGTAPTPKPKPKPKPVRYAITARDEKGSVIKQWVTRYPGLSLVKWNISARRPARITVVRL